MVKPLSFKGDKKPSKKRRREARDDADDESPAGVGAADDDASKPSKKAARAADKKRVDEEDTENDDGWVSADVASDVSGPVVFVLPTEPVTALACDAIGKVFTIPVENIVDENPATAEPHDVRMVWVANKIIGTENWRFKGHHGKYVYVHESLA